MLFAVILLIRSGLLAAEPKVEVFPENRYTETLRVITDEDYRPYSFYAADGSPSGHDIELINMVANEMGMNLELRPMSWHDGIAAITAGEADVLLTCDYSDTFAGVDLLAKSEPVSSDYFIVYAKERIVSGDALYGKRIAVMRNGNVTAEIVKMQLSKYCTEYEDNRKAMQALINGEADFAVMRNSVGRVLLRELNAVGIQGYVSIGVSDMCFGIAGGKPELVDRINGALEKLKTAGQLEKLHDKWLTTFVAPYTFRELLSENAWMVALFAVLLALTAVIWITGKVREKKAVEEAYRKELALQERLEAALADADAANRAKTEFLFNMSHDIRTPMNAILGYTDIGLSHAEDTERVRNSLTKIRAAGGHLLNLINDILEMSRIEAGKLSLNENPLDMREAAENVAQMSETLAVPKSIDFAMEIGEIADPYVYADELHINEILINIISNAVKYTPAGGSVRYRIVQNGAPADGKAVYRFEVSDTGIGMSEEFQKHMFESFSREQSATVSRVEGAGLGLSIVKRIADLVDAKLTVRSAPGEGTDFIVEIPFRVLTEEEIGEFLHSRRPAHDADDAALSGSRVLLVEDNEMNREIATDLLTEAGFSVETAADGEIAVRTVREKGAAYYDFILMDIQMPVMNGYDATRQIRALPDGGTVPIIALSANAFEEDRRKSLDAGMNAHVAKPIDMRLLTDTMKRLSGCL